MTSSLHNRDPVTSALRNIKAVPGKTTITGNLIVNGSIVGYVPLVDFESLTSRVVTVETKTTAITYASGNTTVVGSSVFDSPTLFVDSTNHRVGVGTITPASKLEVAGTARITNAGDGVDLLYFNTERPWVFKQTGTGAAAALALRTTNDGKAFSIQGYGGTDKFKFYLNDVGTTYLAISGDLIVDSTTLRVDSVNNRVGVGTSAPVYTLDVTGTFRTTLGALIGGFVDINSTTKIVAITGALSTTGNVTIGGNITNTWLSELGDRVATNENGIAGTSASIATLTLGAAAMQTQISGNTASIATLNGTVGTITADLVAIDGSIATLQGRVTTAESNIGTLTSSVSQHELSIGALSLSTTGQTYSNGWTTLAGNIRANSGVMTDIYLGPSGGGFSPMSAEPMMMALGVEGDPMIIMETAAVTTSPVLTADGSVSINGDLTVSGGPSTGYITSDKVEVKNRNLAVCDAYGNGPISPATEDPRAGYPINKFWGDTDFNHIVRIFRSQDYTGMFNHFGPCLQMLNEYGAVGHMTSMQIGHDFKSSNNSTVMYFKYYGDGDPNNRFVIDTNGNQSSSTPSFVITMPPIPEMGKVGIHNASPVSPLDVKGDVTFRDVTTGKAIFTTTTVQDTTATVEFHSTAATSGTTTFMLCDTINNTMALYNVTTGQRFALFDAVRGWTRFGANIDDNINAGHIVSNIALFQTNTTVEGTFTVGASPTLLYANVPQRKIGLFGAAVGASTEDLVCAGSSRFTGNLSISNSTLGLTGTLSRFYMGGTVPDPLTYYFELATGKTAKFGSTVTIDGALTVGSGNALKVDTTNTRVGIGIAAPTVALDVVGAMKLTGDLTVDTTTLRVDSTNNRVGIGIAAPTVALDVVGAIKCSSTLAVTGTTAFGNNITQSAGTLTTPTVRLANTTGDANVGFYLSGYGNVLYIDGRSETTGLANADISFRTSLAGSAARRNVLDLKADLSSRFYGNVTIAGTITNTALETRLSALEGGGTSQTGRITALETKTTGLSYASATSTITGGFVADTLVVDNINHCIGIGTSTPTTELQVIGRIKGTDGYFTNSVTIDGTLNNPGLSTQLSTIDSTLTTQGTRLTSAESTLTSHESRLSTAETTIASHTTKTDMLRLDTRDGSASTGTVTIGAENPDKDIFSGYTFTTSPQYGFTFTPTSIMTGYEGYKIVSNSGSSWRSGKNYAGATGNYFGAQSITISGTAYTGDRIEIIFPYSVYLRGYAVAFDVIDGSIPKTAVIGAYNGTTWDLIGNHSYTSALATKVASNVFTVFNDTLYTRLCIVVTGCWLNAGSNIGILARGLTFTCYRKTTDTSLYFPGTVEIGRSHVPISTPPSDGLTVHSALKVTNTATFLGGAAFGDFANWDPLNGSTYSMAGTGYYVLPGGLMVCWTGLGDPGSTNSNWTFPNGGFTVVYGCQCTVTATGGIGFGPVVQTLSNTAVSIDTSYGNSDKKACYVFAYGKK